MRKSTLELECAAVLRQAEAARARRLGRAAPAARLRPPADEAAELREEAQEADEVMREQGLYAEGYGPRR